MKRSVTFFLLLSAVVVWATAAPARTSQDYMQAHDDLAPEQAAPSENESLSQSTTSSGLDTGRVDSNCTCQEGVENLHAGNYGKAMSIFQKFAAEGKAAAMNNIGWMYEFGLGVPADPAAAIRWYRMGADHGSAISMYNIGDLYENGRGGATIDNNEALAWFQRSASAGDEQAVARIAKVQGKIAYAHQFGAALPWTTRKPYRNKRGRQNLETRPP